MLAGARGVFDGHSDFGLHKVRRRLCPRGRPLRLGPRRTFTLADPDQFEKLYLDPSTPAAVELATRPRQPSSAVRGRIVIRQAFPGPEKCVVMLLANWQVSEFEQPTKVPCRTHVCFGDTQLGMSLLGIFGASGSLLTGSAHFKANHLQCRRVSWLFHGVQKSTRPSGDAKKLSRCG